MEKRWNDRVEDLVDNGDVDGAISLLETVIANLETLGSSSSPSGDLRLATALSDLADIHSSRGFSIKADELRSRALLVRAGAVDPPAALMSTDSEALKVKETANQEGEGIRVSKPLDDRQDEDDDWEAVADHGVSLEPLVTQVDLLPKGTPKRRGRGSFLYLKSCLCSEQHDVATTNGGDPVFEEEMKVYDRHLEDCDGKECNSQEAQNNIHCPFKVRQLEEEDDIPSQISRRELEPPIPRPKTSARTAQRLIAQGIGIKFATDFGSNELRKQENARKSRILVRQNMKDDAWGSD